jgi:hypothetical protein
LALLAAVTAALVAASGLAAPTAAAPAAEPVPPTGNPAEARDDEGGTATLRAQLDAATRGYLDAKAALENSRKRQRTLAAHLATVEAELARHTQTIGGLAATAYRNGRLGAAAALINSNSPDGFLDRVAALDSVAARQSQQVRQLVTAREKVQRTQAAVANEINNQRRQVEIMAVRKRQAERALEVAGAGEPAAGPPVEKPQPAAPAKKPVAKKPTTRTPPTKPPVARKPPVVKKPVPAPGPPRAAPAPRNPDGSYPRESCRLNDPTTSGCITARNLHALQQARKAGFTRYCSCFRSGGRGEHPKGRACDYAAQKNGFGGVATGGDRRYGNNLANYFLRNADRLGVLYIIWFKEIWLPSSGWRRYSRAGGDPSSDHSNHVHLSVY